MTDPRRPLPLPSDTPTWCQCGEYQATVGKPLCPVCLDNRAREAKR